jgi:hypothetical protein
MTDKKDDTGKGAPKPGEGPKRPYATIDLQATEVGGKAKGAATAAAGSTKSDPKSAALPPPSATPPGGGSMFSDRMAAVQAWSRSAAQDNNFLSHVAAGVAGAVLTLLASALFGLFSGGDQPSPDIAKRVASLEQAARQRAAAPAGDLAHKLAAAETRLATLEDRTRGVAALGDAQAKLAAETKALEARIGSPELADRLAKLETALASLAAGDPSGRGPQAASLAAKLAELERLAGDAGEAAKSGSARLERDLAVLKTDASRLGQRLDTLRGEIEERFKGAAKAADLAPVMARLTAFEQDLQGFLRGEGERTANAQRVLLTLEMGNLKRAMDRGDLYATELDAVKKAAGTTFNLAALDRYSLEGVPSLRDLTKDFRRVANTAIDAEAEPADASLLDRLLAGTRGIVRVRKAGHSAEDSSAEATLARLEAALKEGRLGEVLAQGKKLPPKAALAAEDWLRKVEARYAIDQSVADIEVALKSSFGTQRVAPAEPRR